MGYKLVKIYFALPAGSMLAGEKINLKGGGEIYTQYSQYILLNVSFVCYCTVLLMLLMGLLHYFNLVPAVDYTCILRNKVTLDMVILNV